MNLGQGGNLYLQDCYSLAGLYSLKHMYDNRFLHNSMSEISDLASGLNNEVYNCSKTSLHALYHDLSSDFASLKPVRTSSLDLFVT